MKWFRITSLGWQVAIVFVLVLFLAWDSMPVPGPDGRVVGELYVCPVSTNPELSAAVAISVFMQGPDGDEVIIVSRARVLKIRTDEPIQVIKWLPTSMPSLFNRLPERVRHRIAGGPVIEVSVTQEEWKRLCETRQELAGYIFHGT